MTLAVALVHQICASTAGDSRFTTELQLSASANLSSATGSSSSSSVQGLPIRTPLVAALLRPLSAAATITIEPRAPGSHTLVKADDEGACAGEIRLHTDTAEKSYSQLVASSAADCCTRCTAAAPKCAFATFGRSSACWLHAGPTMSPRKSAGNISLIVLRKLPPAPRPQPLPPPPPIPAPPALTEGRVVLSAAGTPLRHYWKASVGSGHAYLGLRSDWR